MAFRACVSCPASGLMGGIPTKGRHGLRSIFVASAIAAVVIIVPVTTAAGTSIPGTAPPIKRTLAADNAVPRTCHSSLRPGARGVAVSRWAAPASGFLDVRTTGSTRGDWDLVLFDSSTARPLTASEAFGSREVAQTWVSPGQRLTIQGCHRTGAATQLPLRLQFIQAERPDVPGKPSLVRVQISDSTDVARLSSNEPDTTEDVQDGHCTVHLTGAPQDYLLRNEGFKFTTVDPDMEQNYVDAH